LVARKAANLWRYEHLVEDMTGLIVGAEYNAQTTLSGVLAMVMTHVKPIAINYAMFVNPFATHVLRPPRFIVAGMRKSPGLIEPRETNTLHVPTFQC